MSGDWQRRASGNVGLDHLDLVTLLNCVHDLHLRETSALQEEIARLTAFQVQDAAATSSTPESPAASEAGRAEKKATSIIDVKHERTETTKTGSTENVARDSGRWSRKSSLGEVDHADTLDPANTPMPFTPRRSSQRSSIGEYIRDSCRNIQISDLFKHGQQTRSKDMTLVERLVTSPHFDTCMSIIILVNVLVIALETEYRGLGLASELKPATVGGASPRPDWPAAEQVFVALEWAFGFVFWAELFLRAYGERLRLCKSYLIWIDIVVAVSWTVGKSGLMESINPTLVRVVRVLRVLRLVKLVRSVEIFDSLHMINTAFISSMTALMWFTGVLTIVLTFCALCVTEVLHEYYFDDYNTASDSTMENMYSTEENMWNMFLCFGTFTRSLFSMYELTLANWPPLGRMLSEEVTQWFMLFTVVHKLVIGFALVGVINGMFMQETFTCVALDDAIMVRQKIRQDKQFTEKMHRLFKLADLDQSGTLSFEEFRAILEYKDVRAWLCALGFDGNDVEACFWMLAGEDGRITEEELIEGVQHLRGSARSIDVVTILTRGSVGHNAIRALDEVRAVRPKRNRTGPIDKSKSLESLRGVGQCSHNMASSSHTREDGNGDPDTMENTSSGPDPEQSSTHPSEPQANVTGRISESVVV